MEHGVFDALEVGIDGAVHPENYFRNFSSESMQRESQRLLSEVLRRIDFSGDAAEVKDWYDRNKAKIVFDAKRGLFVVPGVRGKPPSVTVTNPPPRSYPPYGMSPPWYRPGPR